MQSGWNTFSPLYPLLLVTCIFFKNLNLINLNTILMSNYLWAIPECFPSLFLWEKVACFCFFFYCWWTLMKCTFSRQGPCLGAFSVGVHPKYVWFTDLFALTCFRKLSAAAFCMNHLHSFRILITAFGACFVCWRVSC